MLRQAQHDKLGWTLYQAKIAAYVSLDFCHNFIKKKCEALSWLRTRTIIKQKTLISVANATL